MLPAMTHLLAHGGWTGGGIVDGGGKASEDNHAFHDHQKARKDNSQDVGDGWCRPCRCAAISLLGDLFS